MPFLAGCGITAAFFFPAGLPAMSRKRFEPIENLWIRSNGMAAQLRRKVGAVGDHPADPRP
jgi:hypothetical protein